jgi:hypothetical protein
VKYVAASEYDLLTVARGVVGQLGAEAVAPLLRGERRAPELLGPTSMGLLKELLARGVVLELCRRGGWRDVEHLRGGQVVSGRLWERGPLPALRFSGATVVLLRWMTGTALALGARKGLDHLPETTLGDEVLLYLACDLAERCGCGAAVGGSPLVRRTALCWLGFPDVLARQGQPPDRVLTTDTARRWVQGEGAPLLEALQPDLARRWLTVERRKRQIVRPATMIDLGVAQTQVLETFGAAADAAGRRDLLGFLCAASRSLLGHRPPAADWVSGLAAQGTMHERQAAHRAAGAALRGLDRVAGWVQEAQSVRYFEEEHAAAQLILRQWQGVGTVGHEHARQIVAQLESLATPVSGPAAAARGGTEVRR